MHARLSKHTGFTLIELMIVVAIIGILASIAIPKFANLVRKSKEGASKGNLGAIRSTISIYYSDMEGQFPAQLAGMTINGKYLTAIPNGKTPDYHFDTSAEYDNNFPWVGGNPWFGDLGGWTYDAPLGDTRVGTVVVDCTHTDSKGTVWTAY